jgi:transcriptional regulator with XRE-family HTH domain
MILDRTKAHRLELDCKIVGRSIAAARRSRGWTQEDLAEAMGISWHTVVGWENGVRLPQTRYLGTLANLLRRSLDHLLLQRKRGAKHWKTVTS